MSYWPFPKGSTEIWYAKNPRFGYMRPGDKPYSPMSLSKTHVLLGNVAETDLEEIFRMMQGENWSPEGEARELIQSKGLKHTSMSVGDVAVVNGKAMEVSDAGFTPLGESRVEHIVNRLLEDEEKGKNGYIAFWKGKKIEVHADSSYAAQKIAAEKFGAKKSFEVNVVLAQKDGETVTHDTAEFG